MICEMCGKETATVYYTEIVGGKIIELHLCDKCAKKKGVGKELGESAFSLADLLAGMTEEFGEREEDSRLRCPTCGLSYLEFRKVGKLGCATCYDTFRESLLSLLRRIHGSTHHTGKLVVTGGDLETKREIMDLRKELQKAVEKEAFEEAVKIRDSIEAKEKNLSNKES